MAAAEAKAEYSAILLRVTGNVGGRIVQLLIKKPLCEKVVVVTRRKTDSFAGPKVSEVVVNMDRLEEEVAPHAQGVDVVLAAFGVGKGSAKMPEEEVHKIEIAYPQAFCHIATGAVFTECKPRHRHQEFLSFLRQLDACIPEQLDVHLIVDNYATHKHSKVRTWLAQQPRYHIHYTPTYSSWLNQVERWFGLITQRAIPPRLLQQRQRFDRKDRLLCPALQSLASTLRLDRYSGFHPGKDLSTLFSYFGTRQ